MLTLTTRCHQWDQQSFHILFTLISNQSWFLVQAQVGVLTTLFTWRKITVTNTTKNGLTIQITLGLTPIITTTQEELQMSSHPMTVPQAKLTTATSMETCQSLPILLLSNLSPRLRGQPSLPPTPSQLSFFHWLSPPQPTSCSNVERTRSEKRPSRSKLEH